MSSTVCSSYVIALKSPALLPLGTLAQSILELRSARFFRLFAFWRYFRQLSSTAHLAQFLFRHQAHPGGGGRQIAFRVRDGQHTAIHRMSVTGAGKEELVTQLDGIVESSSMREPGDRADRESGVEYR
jgi:hypothetical protein